MSTTHLEKKRAALIDRREKLIARFDKAARGRKSLVRLFTEIHKTNDFLESLDKIAAEAAEAKSGPRRYAVSSLFLHESFKKLTADQDEEFFFITGNEIDGEYLAATEEMLELTESEYAPWTIIEATSKSYTRKEVFETIISAVEKNLGPKAPPPSDISAEASKDAELRAAMESLSGGGL